MSLKKQHGRRARRKPMAVKAVIATAVASVVAGSFVALQPEADATPVPAAMNADEASRLASPLEKKLGADAAGSYYDSAAKRLVVNVVDERDEKLVTKAGAKVREVKRTMRQLAEVKASLDRRTRTPGTSWSVDPRTNKVVVTADATVKGRTWQDLVEKVGAWGDSARVEKTDGVFKPFVDGGDAIISGGARCSAGFNARKGKQFFLITAGHCTRVGADWAAGGSSRRPIGPAVESSFPGNDFAVIKYRNSRSVPPGTVDLHNGRKQAIKGAALPVVGQRVQRSGSTTGLHAGTVTALDTTVNYPQGQVRGLIRTNVCAEPGDSGGALFAGSVALGLTSGGNGSCRRGGTTFFQPVTEVLDRFKLSVELGASAAEKPGSPVPPKKTKRPAKPQPKVPDAAKRVVQLVNQERSRSGCRPLKVNGQLSAAAQKYAGVMGRSGVLSHRGPDGSTMSSRVKAAGYAGSSLGENIAQGQRSPEQVMRAWMGSSGHRANILNCRFQDIGVGVSKVGNGPWWVQNFGTRR
ncbi:CAP domain-containing protein [Streptomyces sp. NPDC003456]|uniref:CAP domain-containing protein n=1 Tax=Streptomyces sp. NPDC003456 TaxID=3364683 RepID=UPI0036832F56